MDAISSDPYTLLSDLEKLYRGSCCAIAVLGFLFYDWLISLGDEVSLIWLSKGRRTIASAVYVFIRYTPIVDALICGIIVWTHRMLPVIQEIAASTFAALRIYAVSSKNRALAAITFLLLLVPSVMALISDVTLVDIKDLPDPFDCIMIVKTSDQFVMLSMISRGCSIAADLLVAGVTWWNAYRTRELGKGIKFRRSAGSVILHDGSLYFIILASLNVMQIIFLRLRLRDPFVVTSDVTLFTDPIASILVSHFLLNLRRVQHASDTASMPSIRIPTLPDIVTSFGGPVHPDFIEPHSPGMGMDFAEKRDSVGDSNGESGQTTSYSASLAGTPEPSTSCGAKSESASL
ncbi:hypothetical protein L227DRAFT_655116 [Lentinus tigrinus ALCF2SS1-6]|uniref:DUF6533 domain-containing protein n=1 Tax=Lentinus tigrinus ALCF2SS1-6 TaxID=1328759 RepID=A0A5C2S598_9APHY|nr:hypothetical protein L227DRAFT_655116 [Lentinus tigrinus ALCF2SS1-6]